jgi:HipA-like protein
MKRPCPQRCTRRRLTFVYSDDWRKAPGAYPLSLSMPLAAKEHGRSVIEAYVWGPLPDDEQVLARWATKFQVSSRNVFPLIFHVGEDCAGAVQVVSRMLRHRISACGTCLNLTGKPRQNSKRRHDRSCTV